MKKILLILILVLVAAVVGAVVFLIGNLDEIVRRSMETVGTDATQAPVAVNEVQIGLTDGSGRIAGITVGSPAGFEAPHAIKLDEAKLSIDTDSLGKDVIVIREVLVSGPDVVYEMSKPGAGNLDTIQENIDAYVKSLGGGSGGSEGGGEGGGGTETAGGGQKLIIEKLSFGGGRIAARASFLDKEASVELPPFEMTDIGKDQGGATGAEIGAEVLKRLVKESLEAATTGQLAGLKEGVIDKAQEAVDDAVEKGKEAIEGLFGR